MPTPQPQSVDTVDNASDSMPPTDETSSGTGIPSQRDVTVAPPVPPAPSEHATIDVTAICQSSLTGHGSDRGTSPAANHGTVTAVAAESEHIANSINVVGANRTNNPVTVDISLTHIPTSEDVTFDHLHLYDIAELSAENYYDATLATDEDQPQTPIVLAAMGIGVPGFPEQIEEDEDMKRAIGKSNGCLWLKTQVSPTSTKAKPYLLKEIMRRLLVNKTPNDDYPKIKNWRIKKCAEWLKNNPPCVADHDAILESWNYIKRMMKEHYMENSGTSVAAMWRLVRLTECLLHVSIRTDLLKRNKKMQRHKLDGRNSPKLPASYYKKSADLYNSKSVLKSRALPASYGDPFNVSIDLYPPSKEHEVTEETVRQRTVKLRGVLLRVDQNIKKSGQGEGSVDGHLTKDFVRGPRGKQTCGNGDATGYTYERIKQEGLFDQFVSVSRDDVAATMANTPRIQSSGDKRRNKNSSSATSAKKTKESESGGGVLNLLMSMNRNMNEADRVDEIDKLHHRVNALETSLLNHRKDNRENSKEYFNLKRKVNADEIGPGPDHDAEEYEYFLHSKETYEACKVQIQDIEERLVSVKEELEQCVKELEKSKKNLEDEQAKEAEVLDITYVNEDEDNGGESHASGTTMRLRRTLAEEQSWCDMSSNDGSVALDDSLIPQVEQID